MLASSRRSSILSSHPTINKTTIEATVVLFMCGVIIAFARTYFERAERTAIPSSFSADVSLGGHSISKIEPLEKVPFSLLGLLSK